MNNRRMLAKNIGKFPSGSGVYVFRAENGRPLYVGKAGNLKSRLSFYFRNEAKRQPRMKKLLEEAVGLSIIRTDSEIEALVKEAELIKRLRPKYNILMRDDKNYLFVVITRENFPRLILTHQPKAFGKKMNIIGPFTDAGALKTVLKLLRRIFPYCTCKSAHKRLCLNAEIGKCPGICCRREREPARTKKQARTDAEREYRKNILAITSILEGKKISSLMRNLKKQINKASRRMEYERAALLRDQLTGLKQILLHRNVIGPEKRGDAAWTEVENKIKSLLRIKLPLIRAEAYDISNISGTEAAGSVAVFINGRADKNEYRKFRIKTVRGANDTAMLAEVIGRRFRHHEWSFPDIVILDGGKPQLSAALAALAELRRQHAESRGQFLRKSASNPRESAYSQRKSALVVALAKRDEELYVAGRKKPVQLKKADREVLHFFQHIRDEAHRYAKKYHHKLRKVAYYNE